MNVEVAEIEGWRVFIQENINMIEKTKYLAIGKQTK